jgi:hypothetical protein
MNCERCGTGLSDYAVICPTCGTITSTAQGPTPPPTTNYGQYAPGGYSGPQQQQAPYGQGYGPQPGYRSSPPPQQSYGYAPQPNVVYQPGPVNVFVNNAPPASNKNNGALVAEILLSLFVGTYGVGWLMAGETTAGIILLICSFVVYWPFMILGTIFTLGIGLICLVPIAIGAIIVNAVLLNNLLNRKAAQMVMVQASSMPPRYPPYQ